MVLTLFAFWLGFGLGREDGVVGACLGFWFVFGLGLVGIHMVLFGVGVGLSVVLLVLLIPGFVFGFVYNVSRVFCFCVFV